MLLFQVFCPLSESGGGGGLTPGSPGRPCTFTVHQIYVFRVLIAPGKAGNVRAGSEGVESEAVQPRRTQRPAWILAPLL